MQQQDLTGHTIGNFSILSELGRGAMGVVYKARQENLKRIVALKILPPHLTRTDMTYVARFHREAQSAAQLEHPGIIPIYEIGEIDGYHYIAMRYIEGETLKMRMERAGAMEIEQVARQIEPVARALDYAHQRGIIHRDVKPSNVMLSQDGSAYLADFGLARAQETRSDMTMAGMILGTPEYMSPEQAKGLPDIGSASDRYSLGIVIYQMLSGKLPFQAESQMEMIYARLQHAPRPLREFRPDLAPETERVINQALAREPEQRYSTAMEMVEALLQSAQPPEQIDDTVIVPRHMDQKAPQSASGGRPRVLLFGATALLLLLLAGGGIWAMGGMFSAWLPGSSTPVAHSTPEAEDVRGASASTPQGAPDTAVATATTQPSNTPAPTRTSAPSPVPTRTPAPSPTALPAPQIDDIAVSSAYVGEFAEWPLLMTITGDALDVFEEAIVSRQDGQGRPRFHEIAVQSPEKVVVTFQSIDDLPAAPDGDAAYAVELRGNGVRQEIVFEARDYIELKEVQGVRADYSYTGRVAVEGDDVYTRMRTNASTDSAPGAILRNGDQLDVVDDTVDGWYKARIRTSSDPEAARLQGQIWWIERWLVDHENVPPRPSPTPIPPTPVPAPTARPYVPVPTTPPAPPRPVATPIPTPGLDL